MKSATIADFDTAPTADEHTIASAWVAQDKAAEGLGDAEVDRLATAAAYGFAAGRVAAQRCESAAVSQLQAEAGVAESTIEELRGDLATMEGERDEYRAEYREIRSAVEGLAEEGESVLDTVARIAADMGRAVLRSELEDANARADAAESALSSWVDVARARELALEALGEGADKSKGLPALVEELGIRLGAARNERDTLRGDVRRTVEAAGKAAASAQERAEGADALADHQHAEIERLEGLHMSALATIGHLQGAGRELLDQARGASRSQVEEVRP